MVMWTDYYMRDIYPIIFHNENIKSKTQQTDTLNNLVKSVINKSINFSIKSNTYVQYIGTRNI